MADESSKPPQLRLPVGVVTRADVGKLALETEAVDSFLRQVAIREAGTPMRLPKATRLFDEIVSINKLNMLQEVDRQRLLQFLQTIRTKAPVLHMSFSTDPSPLFQQRLITWMRQQMHPLVLLQIGMQPGIGAGCVVRSTNKYYDLSLRQRFTDKRMLLISKIQGVDPVEQPQTEVVAKEITA